MTTVPMTNLPEVLRLHQLWLRNDPDGELANLAGADLTKADLTGADLTGANLTRADLYRADLTGANFDGANLIGGDLEAVTVASAIMSHPYAIMGYTNQRKDSSNGSKRNHPDH